MKNIFMAGLCAGLCLMSGPSFAQNVTLSHDGHHTELRADDHAPIGVMGSHMHDQGEWMLSYRYMHMKMDGNRAGTGDISPGEIVTTIPNRFANPPMQPNTLRVVPTEMTMEMHMLGGMYAPADWLTLMLMVNYLEKDMDHITYQGGMGTAQLGTFTTKTSGFGDTKVSGLAKLYEDERHNLHAAAGISLPTGSIDEKDDILTPMDARPRVRLPYAMQLGTGTYDLLPALTYNGHEGRFGWGAQASGEIRLGENSEDYRFGNKYALSLWGSYLWAPSFSTSLRVTGETEGDIHGIDPQIALPVQTADPDNYGGERIAFGLGANYVFTGGFLKGHRIEAEANLPVYQDLNGPQMKRDYAFMIGWSKSF